MWFLDELPEIALIIWTSVAIALAIELGRWMTQRRSDEWVYVSKKVARQHRLYGIGGWNYLLLLGLVIGSPIAAAAELGRYFADFVGSFESASAASNVPRSLARELALSAVWQPPALFVTIYIIFVTVGAVIAIWACAGLLSIKSLYFRGLYISTIVTLWACDLGLVFYIAARYGISLALQLEIVVTSAVAFLVGFPWIVYVLKSRRINVTQLHRVRPNDPFLRELRMSDHRDGDDNVSSDSIAFYGPLSPSATPLMNAFSITSKRTMPAAPSAPRRSPALAMNQA